MNKIKETYDRPTTDVLVIRFEESFLSPGVTVSGATRGNGYGDNTMHLLDDDD